jgi:hypothetical protein
MIMKKVMLSLTAIAALTATTFAGTAVVSTGKEVKNPIEPTCFEAGEFQLDVFGSYTGGGHYQDGFGGGLGLNYFFTKYIGFGVDGNVYDGGVDGRWTVSGNLIFRLPIDSACVAPYLLVGGGYGADGINEAIINAGGGLEYRFIPNRMGVFAEGRYTWAADTNGTGQARVGLKFVF